MWFALNLWGWGNPTNASGAGIESMLPQGQTPIIHAMQIRSFCFVKPHKLEQFVQRFKTQGFCAESWQVDLHTNLAMSWLTAVPRGPNTSEACLQPSCQMLVRPALKQHMLTKEEARLSKFQESPQGWTRQPRAYFTRRETTRETTWHF